MKIRVDNHRNGIREPRNKGSDKGLKIKVLKNFLRPSVEGGWMILSSIRITECRH